MSRKFVAVLVALFCVIGSVAFSQGLGAGSDKGLVGYWSFDKGKGAVLNDHSGQGNDGQIHGAKWVKSGRGYALSFNGKTDYVDCGNSSSLDITGPITVQAWMQPRLDNRGEAGVAGKSLDSYALTLRTSTFSKNSPRFHISSDDNSISCLAGIVGSWMHIVATFDGATMRTYRNGQEIEVKDSTYKHINHGKNFLIGCLASSLSSNNSNVRKGVFFRGLIDAVRVHNRVLSPNEILYYYNQDAEQKGQRPFDLSVLGKLFLEPFFYPDANKAILSVTSRWAMPLAEGTTIVAELAVAGASEALESKTINPNAPRNEDEAEFCLKGLKAGSYELRTILRDGKGSEKIQRVQFDYPFDPLSPVPGPQSHLVGSLPAPLTPPQYKVTVNPGGGLTVVINGESYQIESSYSYPHGGYNRLLAGADDNNGEKKWKVTINKLDQKTYKVTASGDYYSISRLVTLEKTRIFVEDTLTNTSDDVVGIILSNYLNLTGVEDAKLTMMGNPTVYAGLKNSGVGLIAMDDLYYIQMRTNFSDGIAEIRDEHFGLDKGASYTIKWAIYPTGRADHLDFINQVRKDHGLNGHMEGAFGFVPPTLSLSPTKANPWAVNPLANIWRTKAPPKQYMDLHNIKYSSIGVLGRPLPDDPTGTLALEGIEFTEYPKESAQLKKTFAETKRLYPGVKVMFHVAPGLYITNKPDELFPDSKAVHPDGRQMHYGPNTVEYYGPRLSKERFEDGWRWWLFYPTLENSFGKAMIKATDYMLNEIGATGMFGDGFISGYVRGGYSYDKWDGHSVTIDPKTKLVTRKKTCVPYVALPVYKKVIRMISAKGGVVVTNGQPGPPSLWNEAMFSSCETASGDQYPISGLYLGRTMTPLTRHRVPKNERDVYRDIVTKLDYGSLFAWLGGRGFISHRNITEHMFPFTFDILRPGTVYGTQRIVTKKSGNYGWDNDTKALHIVYLYDQRGAPVRSNFVSTVDRRGSRTELNLQYQQSAVIVKLPVTLSTSSPVNINVRQYDPEIIRLALNGKGRARVNVACGEFPVDADGKYQLIVDGKSSVIKPQDGQLGFDLELDGQANLEIRTAG